METLPPEMVEEISHYLTVKDLAHCIAVSRGWHEAFNQDIVWRPHCDPALEERLRNTPCTVEPVFVEPEDKESTLSPICQWRLSFMREEHLRGNFKRGFRKKEHLPGSDSVFLTDTLLITWNLSAIELWDVGHSPVTMLMKTDPSIVVERWTGCTVVGSDTLVVKQDTCVQVFLVDLKNKIISLEREIQFNERHIAFVVKHFGYFDQSIYYIGVAESTRNCLNVWDIKKGIKIKLEHFPLETDHGIIYALHSTALSEDILVLFRKKCSDDMLCIYHSYSFVYSVKQLSYIFGPTRNDIFNEHLCQINQHFLLYCSQDSSKLEIVDYQTSETIFDLKKNLVQCVEAFHNCFLFLESNDKECTLSLFDLSKKKFSIVFKCPIPIFDSCLLLQTHQNKIIIIYGQNYCDETIAVFRYSHSSLQRVDMDFPIINEMFNKSFTRSYSWECEEGVDIWYNW